MKHAIRKGEITCRNCKRFKATNKCWLNKEAKSCNDFSIMNK